MLGRINGPRVPTSAKNYIEYTGSSPIPVVTTGTNVLCLNWGTCPTPNSITPTNTLASPVYGSLYAGAGITVVGASDRNVIIWGGNNRASPGSNAFAKLNGAVDSVVIEGGGNTGANTTVPIPSQCIMIGTAAAGSVSTPVGTSISIGFGSQALGTNGIAIGFSGTPSGNNHVCIGTAISNAGASNIVIGNSSNGGSGTNCIVMGNSYTWGGNVSNTICLGSGAQADFAGEINICNAGFANQSDIHTSRFPYYGYTTNATPLELATGGASYSTTPSGHIVLSNNASYAFTIDIVAQTKGGAVDCAMWTTQFLIQRGANAAATALVGTPSGLTTPLFATTGATTNSWAVAVTADTSNGRPAIKVTGAASTNISWVANVKMTKVGY